MKLIVQIPCYNEENTLPETILDIPRKINGIDIIEILVIDDGSSDRTSEIARECGVEHVLRHKKNMGLARSFRNGLDFCLKQGADIIVNTDGDNQYSGKDISKLIEPILSGTADIVVGDRQTQSIPHFSLVKKILQKIGSATVRQLSGIEIPDAVSGFRAFTKDVAIKLNIISSFSYTTEMLIQAGKKQMVVVSVAINTNPEARKSRLFKSTSQFIYRTLSTMIRMYAMYQPLKVFVCVGSFFVIVGFLPIIRFLVLYYNGMGDGHIQSLLLGSLFLIIGFLIFMMGFIADLISQNRQLTEMTLEKIRKVELDSLSWKKSNSDSDSDGY